MDDKQRIAELEAENARLRRELDNSLYAESLWNTANVALQEAAKHFGVVAGTHKADVAVMLWKAYQALQPPTEGTPPKPRQSIAEVMAELRDLIGHYYDAVDPDTLRDDDDAPTEGA